MLEVVTGGSASGKSAYAETQVQEVQGMRKYYIATMRPWDEECVKKIEKHRQMRADKHFETLECYEDLHLVKIEPESVVLLECMSNLVANEYYRQDMNCNEVVERITAGIIHLQKQTKTLMIVTNEVFSDGGIYGEETRAYIEILGDVNKTLAKMADRVTEVVYGIPITIRLSCRTTT